MDRNYAVTEQEKLAIDSLNTEQDRPCSQERLREVLEEASRITGELKADEAAQWMSEQLDDGIEGAMLYELAHRGVITSHKSRGSNYHFYRRLSGQGVVDAVECYWESYGTFWLSPTPGEIRKLTLEMQESWSDRERYMRADINLPSPMVLHVAGYDYHKNISCVEVIRT